MKYNKLLCLALVFTILLGCAPFQTTYKEDEKTSNWDYPTQKEKDKSFFLILFNIEKKFLFELMQL